MPPEDGSLTIETAIRSAVTDRVSRLDARLLLMHCLGCTLEDLIADDRKRLSPDQTKLFKSLLSRRAQGEPVAQIVQHKEFWGLPFMVTKDVLSPRPDTETVIELALELCGDQPPSSILDIGTGSGCLLAALMHEYPAATGVGLDICPKALAIASGNIADLGLQQRARLEQESFHGELTGRYDLIVSNPPYIKDDDRAGLPVDVRDYEPAGALFAGDGFDAYRAIVPQLPGLLNDPGTVVLEVGENQADRVAEMVAETFQRERGPVSIMVKKDMAGIPRAVGARAS